MSQHSGKLSSNQRPNPLHPINTSLHRLLHTLLVTVKAAAVAGEYPVGIQNPQTHTKSSNSSSRSARNSAAMAAKSSSPLNMPINSSQGFSWIGGVEGYNSCKNGWVMMS
jgi:hypothetical protein